LKEIDLKPMTLVITILLVAFAAVATVVGYFPLVIVIWLAIWLCLIKLRDELAEATARRKAG
jgi:hypothetical protein